MLEDVAVYLTLAPLLAGMAMLAMAVRARRARPAEVRLLVRVRDRRRS